VYLTLLSPGHQPFSMGWHWEEACRASRSSGTGVAVAVVSGGGGALPEGCEGEGEELHCGMGGIGRGRRLLSPLGRVMGDETR
jgi:hypothetical protein